MDHMHMLDWLTREHNIRDSWWTLLIIHETILWILKHLIVLHIWVFWEKQQDILPPRQLYDKFYTVHMGPCAPWFPTYSPHMKFCSVGYGEELKNVFF